MGGCRLQRLERPNCRVEHRPFPGRSFAAPEGTQPLWGMVSKCSRDITTGSGSMGSNTWRSGPRGISTPRRDSRRHLTDLTAEPADEARESDQDPPQGGLWAHHRPRESRSDVGDKSIGCSAPVPTMKGDCRGVRNAAFAVAAGMYLCVGSHTLRAQEECPIARTKVEMALAIQSHKIPFVVEYHYWYPPLDEEERLVRVIRYDGAAVTLESSHSGAGWDWRRFDGWTRYHLERDGGFLVDWPRRNTWTSGMKGGTAGIYSEDAFFRTTGWWPTDFYDPRGKPREHGGGMADLLRNPAASFAYGEPVAGRAIITCDVAGVEVVKLDGAHGYSPISRRWYYASGQWGFVVRVQSFFRLDQSMWIPQEFVVCLRDASLGRTTVVRGQLVAVGGLESPENWDVGEDPRTRRGACYLDRGSGIIVQTNGGGLGLIRNRVAVLRARLDAGVRRRGLGQRLALAGLCIVSVLLLQLVAGRLVVERRQKHVRG